MVKLRIQVLGPFQVWRDDHLIAPEEWPGHKARQLLKILLTRRGHTVPTDQLIEWLWPDLTPASARNSLWVAVSRLRRLLEPHLTTPSASTYILTLPNAYLFDPAGRCQIDAGDFLTRCRQGQAAAGLGDQAAAITTYRAAEDLYRDDYLAEDLYEDWAIPTREHLREAFLDIENALATCYMAKGDYREALVRCHRVLAHDTCRESAWRLAMECYYRAGEQGQALRAFERCRTELARELGVDPMPATVALHERILRAAMQRSGDSEIGGRRDISPSSAPAFSLSLRLPLVGRDKEWALLSRLLDEAMDGQGRVVLMAGKPGIGKTRLLEELAGLATARGANVLSTHCDELDQNLAYAPIVEALHRTPLPCSPARVLSEGKGFCSLTPRLPCSPAQIAAMAELLPELRRTFPDVPAYQPLPPDEERLRILTTLSRIIRCSAHDDSLVLLVDDLHWAGPSTLQLFHHLGRQIHDQPVLLAGAYRPPQVANQHLLSAAKVSLSRLGVLTELVLPALGEEEVVLLLRRLGSKNQGDELARRLYRDTEGHPFFLVEVLRTFIQEGLITVGSEGGWRTAYDEVTDSYQELLLPPTLRAAVLGRLDRLAPDDRALLDLASVIGREFTVPLLARMLGRPEAVLVAQMDRLAERGFLSPSVAGGYEFGNNLMRRAAYEALSEPRRRLLHRQVADALLVPPTVTGNGIAGRVATHYAASDRPWLGLEHALVAVDEAAKVIAYDEAIAWCQQALDIVEAHPAAVPPGFRTRLHLRWRTLWYYRGDLERTLAADRAALAAARGDEDRTAELQALWHLAHDETQIAAGASGVHQRAVSLARDLGEPGALARSLARLGSDAGFVATPGERKQALAYLQQAVALARKGEDLSLLHHVLTELWGVAPMPQARTALEEALTLVRQLGDRREEVGTLAKLADVLTRQGDFTTASDYAGEGLALAEQVDSPTYGAWNRRALGQALVALGRVTEGLAQLEKAARTFEAHAWPAMLAGTLLRLGLALQLAGACERATEALERVLTLSRETHEPYEAAYALAALGVGHLTQGDITAGRQALDEAGGLAPRIGLPWHRGGTLVTLAAGRLLLCEAEEALTRADEAVHLAEAEDLREVQAHGLWLRGRALLAMGLTNQAQAALARGLAQAEAINHVWLQRQLLLAENGSLLNK